MFKLLIEYPEGNQQIVQVTETGSFFDESKVLWDERVNGALPEDLELGKMTRVNGELVKSDNFIPGREEYIQAQEQKIIRKNVADLWAAADAYIYTNINGAGLSILASGTQLGKPKAKAVSVWIDSIWAEYYVRKAAVNAADPVNLDFSNFGNMPFTVLELREEVAYLWVSAP